MQPAMPTVPSFGAKCTMNLVGCIGSRMAKLLCRSNVTGPDYINLEPKYTGVACTEGDNHDRFVLPLGDIAATSSWG